MSPLADRWIRAVCAIKDGPLRVAYLRSEIARADSPDVASALNDLCARAEQADARARDALAAAVPSLTDEALADRIGELRALAIESALHPLARLLRQKQKQQKQKQQSRASSSRPDSAESKDARRQNRAAKAGARPLTLGERKSLARTLRTKGALEKLLVDPHPQVIRYLLTNPRITEDDIIRLVARRPASAEILGEVVRHPTWPQRPRVRMAILQNPGAPAEIAVPLVRLLVRPELREIAAAADIAPVVRAAAAELLARRPPIPEGRGRPRDPTQ